MLATQDQVRNAIKALSTVPTNAAEALEAITEKTIEKTDSDRKHYSDVSTLLTRAGLPGDAIVDSIRADLLANGPAWICDQLGGIGIDFSHDQLQSKLDEMKAAGRITSQLATILKSIGRWKESILESINQVRGLTTDEQTVEIVLSSIKEQEQNIAYTYRQAVISIVLQPNGKAILS